MQLVKPGGFLVTASCTNLVQPEVFLDTISKAARDAKRTLRQVEFRAQASDHPILWNMENTNYLKFLPFYSLMHCPIKLRLEII